MSDKIRFSCSCGKTLAADSSLAGKKAKCASCGQVVQIPARTTPLSQELELAPLDDAPPRRTTSRPAAPTTIPDHVEKSLLDEDDEYALAATPKTRCEQCGAPMPPNASMCLECRYSPPPKPSAELVAWEAQRQKRSRPSLLAKVDIWVVLAVAAPALGLLYLGASRWQFIMILGGFAGGLLMFGGFGVSFIGVIWFWALMLRHDQGGAGRMLISVLAAPFGFIVSWRGGFSDDNPVYDRAKRLMTYGAIAMIAGALVFLACIMPHLIRGRPRA